MIIRNEERLKASESTRETEHSRCLKAGYISYTGEFIRYYTDLYCTTLKNTYDDIVNIYKTNFDYWKQKLEKDQDLLSLYLEDEKKFENWKDFWSYYKNETKFELGTFEAPKTITLALDFTSNEKLPVYLSTLVHEYYHYTSYVSEERVLPLFFEEGLTDYFSKKTYKGDLQIGYPVIVDVINQMTKRIPEDTFLEIYLTKDKIGLVNLLNKHYGDDFYNKYEVYFEILPYFKKEDQIKVAHDIISRIGGVN